MNDEFLTNSNACLIIGCPLSMSMSHQSDIEIVFRHFDLNKDKYLNFDEFCSLCRRIHREEGRRGRGRRGYEKRRGSMMGREMDDWASQLQEIFQKLDTNQNHQIEEEEALQVVRLLEPALVPTGYAQQSRCSPPHTPSNPHKSQLPVRSCPDCVRCWIIGKD